MFQIVKGTKNLDNLETKYELADLYHHPLPKK